MRLCRLFNGNLFWIVLLSSISISTACLAGASASPPPPVLEQVMEIGEGVQLEKDDSGIRDESIRDAAISYGARAGLARRTYEIRKQLAQSEAALTQTFDFRRLLIAAPSGLLIEPPVVTEAQEAFLIEAGGQTAAVADRIYHINQRAKIVSTARDWRSYLERDWGEIPSPPALLLPVNEHERKLWRQWSEEGWRQGYSQADEIFQLDLDRLMRDFTGMVRYRELLAQNMITAPYAALEDRGVSGGGRSMHVGDRQVTITAPSALNARSELWLPAIR